MKLPRAFYQHIRQSNTTIKQNGEFRASSSPIRSFYMFLSQSVQKTCALPPNRSFSTLIPQSVPKSCAKPYPGLTSSKVISIVRCSKYNSTKVGTFGDIPTTITQEDKQFVVREPSPEDLSSQTVRSDVRPLVVVFGWAGSNHKNLDKYSQVYRSLGCTTLQYILPTRFIFRYTEQIPEVMDSLSCELSQRLRTQPSTPLLVHSLSDTGVMTFQGLHRSAITNKSPLPISGIVWDSCPGPRPVVTIPKGFVLCAINWLSRMRDGMGFGGALTSSYKDFIDLAWNNYIRRLKGEECLLSLIDKTWCGHWARDLDTKGPELFLFSENDIYMPSKWLKEGVIPYREKGRDVTAMCWEKSTHVAHIKDHREEYFKHIQQFVKKAIK